jgi:hypothetical protein
VHCGNLYSKNLRKEVEKKINFEFVALLEMWCDTGVSDFVNHHFAETFWKVDVMVQFCDQYKIHNSLTSSGISAKLGWQNIINPYRKLPLRINIEYYSQVKQTRGGAKYVWRRNNLIWPSATRMNKAPGLPVWRLDSLILEYATDLRWAGIIAASASDGVTEQWIR